MTEKDTFLPHGAVQLAGEIWARELDMDFDEARNRVAAEMRRGWPGMFEDQVELCVNMGAEIATAPGINEAV